MELPWTEARRFTASLERLEREDLRARLIVARAAQAEDKGFRRVLKLLDSE